MFKLFVFILVLGETLSSYDEFLSCDRQYENMRSARVLDLVPPDCDMTQQSFCYEKGHAYPDKAIKRFLKENLGLMRRMSSDVDSKEVVREMRSASFNIYTDPVHDDLEGDQYREDKSSNFNMHMMPPGENVFNGLSYNIKLGSGLAMVKNAKDEVIRDIEQVPAQTTTKKPRTSTSGTVQTSTSHTTMIVTTSQSTSRSPSPSTTVPTTRQETTSNIAPSTVTEQASTNTVVNTAQTETIVTVQEDTTLPALNEEEVYYDEYEDDEGSGEYLPSAEYLADNEEELNFEQSLNTEFSDLQNVLSNLNPEDLEEQLPDILPIFDTESESSPDAASVTEEVEEPVTEEVEKDPEIEYTGDPINACDVNESVQAPYWANNTRNHTLALLNLYPFEQYIHMETCKAEFEEMLCRPGCRCEQQYRLHRLLAFDPNNECRGIFSDWFKFPSFCLCKCYASAIQLRESMRNPKKQNFSPKERTHQGPGPTHNMKNSRLANHRMTKEPKGFDPTMDNIPAVFPYEGRAMLFEELNNNHRGGKEIRPEPRKMEIPLETQIQEENSESPQDIILDAIADEHMDNTVESDQVHFKKSHKQARLLDDHFFYNQPIVDFKLSDGTMGTLEQTPRK